MARRKEIRGYDVIIDNSRIYVFWNDSWYWVPNDEEGRNTLSLSRIPDSVATRRFPEDGVPGHAFYEIPIEELDHVRRLIMRLYGMGDKNIIGEIAPGFMWEMVDSKGPQELERLGRVYSAREEKEKTLKSH